VDRLVEDPVAFDARINLAMDEALIRSAPSVPVLRLWLNRSCVVLGRGQQVAREVDVAVCLRDGVSVYRRASGGGAGSHDVGHSNITVVRPGWGPAIQGDLGGASVAALTGLGLSPEADGRGVHLAGGKVSGFAAQVTRTASLAHATLLVTTPPDRIGAYLSANPGERQPLDSVRATVTTLAAHLPGLDIASARAAVLAAAARRDGPLRPRSPTTAEVRWRDRLLGERYLRQSWHLTGRTSEASWMRRPSVSSTA
jgi:lipoate-protein ligase A